MALNILHIDARRDDARAAIAELRRRLSPEGNVVSEAGRRRTLEVFGEALSPQHRRRLHDDNAADPTDAKACYNRGHIHHDDGEYGATIGGYTEAIRINPALTHPLVNRG